MILDVGLPLNHGILIQLTPNKSVVIGGSVASFYIFYYYCHGRPQAGARGADALPWNVGICHPSHPHKMCKNTLTSTLKIFKNWDIAPYPYCILGRAMASLPRQYFISIMAVCSLLETFSPSVVSNSCPLEKFSVGAHDYCYCCCRYYCLQSNYTYLLCRCEHAVVLFFVLVSCVLCH